jgi:hypothetical protein
MTWQMTAVRSKEKTMNNQQFFTNVGGSRFSPNAVKLMVGRVLRSANRQETAIIRRFLNGGALSEQDAARLRPLFEREAKNMVRQRSAA